MLWCATCASLERRRETCCIRGRWSLGLQRTNLSKGFSTKKMPEIRRWFLRVILSLVLIFYPILRVTYRGTDIFLIKFTGKPWKSTKSFLSGHKWEGVNTKVTQNFRSLVINKLAAQYLYNIHTLTILFGTILGRACDVREIIHRRNCYLKGVEGMSHARQHDSCSPAWIMLANIAHLRPVDKK